MTDLIWPLAVVAISTVFFLIFREPLSTLIKRTKSIGRDGFDASHDSPLDLQARLQDGHFEPLAALRQAHLDTIAELHKAHFAEIARIEQRFAERYATDIESLRQATMNQAEAIANLEADVIHLTAGLKTIYSFEFIQKFMVHKGIPAFA